MKQIEDNAALYSTSHCQNQSQHLEQHFFDEEKTEGEEAK